MLTTKGNPATGSSGWTERRKPTTRKNIGWLYTSWTIDPQDINAISASIDTLCDDVHLYAIDKANPDKSKLRNVIKSPCVVFAQCGLSIRPPRGRAFDPRPIPKTDQAAIFRQNGIPHPRSALYKPGATYAESEFGPIVIAKPIRGSRGRGILALETRLIQKYSDEIAKIGEANKSPMMIQAYVDTGEHIAKYRVLLLFGAVLYALKRSSVERRPVSLQSEFVSDQFVQSHGVKKDTTFCHEADVLETARRVASALSEIPVIGVDLIREAATGTVYVVEANIGNTWHFSSEIGAGTRRNVGGRDVLISEFDAWNVAARRLIEVARTYAV